MQVHNACVLEADTPNDVRIQLAPQLPVTENLHTTSDSRRDSTHQPSFRCWRWKYKAASHNETISRPSHARSTGGPYASPAGLSLAGPSPTGIPDSDRHAADPQGCAITSRHFYAAATLSTPACCCAGCAAACVARSGRCCRENHRDRQWHCRAGWTAADSQQADAATVRLQSRH
jgi:hypothetical protein